MSERKNGRNAPRTGAKIHFSKRDIFGLGHLKLPDTLNFRGHFVKKEKKNDICVGIQFAFEMEKKMLDITSGHLLSIRFESHGVNS